MDLDQQKKLAIAKRLSALSNEKRAALTQRLEQEGIDIWQLPIVPVDLSGKQPPLAQLSFAQQRLWFIDQVNPGNPQYNLFFGLRFNGRLNAFALETSINTLIERHEILRTNVVDHEGVGYQRVNAFNPMALDTVDFTDVDSGDLESKLIELAKQEADKPFNLTSDLLFRFTLVKISNEEHVGFFTIHHMVFDAWSTENLMIEFSQLYQAFATEQTPSLPELPIQYKDFSVWQRQWTQSQAYAHQKAYWQQQLANPPEPLTLSIQRSKIATDSNVDTNTDNSYEDKASGCELSYALSDDLSPKLYQAAKSQGATLYMVMLAAFNVLLSRYSGEKDICVGTSIANRPRLETEPLLGYFVNTLVMRNQVDEATTFSDFLTSVNQTASNAYLNQDLPFDHLLDILDIERSDSHSALFQVLFVMNNATVGDANAQLTLPGLTVGGFQKPLDHARFDLTLRITELPNRSIRCDLEYDPTLYARDDVSALLSHYENILAQLVASPEQALSECSLLNKKDVTEHVGLGIFEHKTFSDPQTVHELFEAAVVKHADSDALVCSDTRLSYRQLNHQANQLAHYLRSQGVAADVPVALLMDRSASFVVGLLAVLKAGGCYVPLDTQWPAARLQNLIDDCGAQLLLSETAWQTTANSLSVNALILDQTSEPVLWANEPTDNPTPIATNNNLAYMIYTSGSTGKPKGVMIEHQQLINYACGVMTRFFGSEILGSEINGSELNYSFASVSTVAADLGNTSIYGALAFGGCLHLIDAERSFSPDAVASYMDEHQVDVIKIVPSHLQGLLAANEPQRLLPKTLLILGGEACPNSLIAQVRQLAPELRIVNHYGPTETTVGVLTHEIPFQTEYTGSFPVGKPLPNSQTYILDAGGHICPTGVAGELFVGGDSVARGYLGQPELTQERFIERQLHASQPAQRLYRTGDKARWLSNGDIDFLGRLDEQVKLRGYRVELGDIRTCLCEQDGVRDAVVQVIRGDVSERLVAFLVKEESVKEGASTGADTQRVQSALEEKLPPYMVPQQWLWLDSLPLTINGKLDRRELIALADAGPDSDAVEGREPRDQLEQQLVAIWSQILRRDSVSIDDNFFELGGDSILSLQVIAKAKKAGITLTPKQLFDEQTIARLSQVAVTAQSDIEQQLVEIWSGVLKRDDIDRHDNFFALGGDSILSLQVVAKARKAGLKVTPKQLFDEQTVAKLAAVVEYNESKTSKSQESVSGDVPLTPIQSWFFEADHPNKHHWNQSLAFAVKQKLDVNALEKSIETLIAQHDQLRCEFKVVDNQWQQSVREYQAGTANDYLHVENWLDDSALSHSITSHPITKAEQDKLDEKFVEIANQWQANLSLSGEPVSSDNGTENKAENKTLFAVVLFPGNDEINDRLLIIAHHLLVDGVSWRVLLEDLQLSYEAQLTQTKSSLPEKSVSFQQWAKQLHTVAKNDHSQWYKDAFNYWTQTRDSVNEQSVPVKSPTLTATLKETQEFRSQLSKEATDLLLYKAPSAYKTRINDLLLSALWLTIAKQCHTNQDDSNSALSNNVYLELEGHGREILEQELDTSRTVGWFTSRFPVLLSGPQSQSNDEHGNEFVGELIKTVKEQLRKIPAQGMSFGVLNYLSKSLSQNELSENKGSNTSFPTPVISFNYLGQLSLESDALFEPLVNLPAMTERHPDSVVNHGIDINVSVVDGVLQSHWRIAQTLVPQFEVNHLADDFTEALNAVVEHCLQPENKAYTPSDFELTHVSQTQLDTLVANIGYDNVFDIYPLTPVQQGMLFHSLLDAELTTDNDESETQVTGAAYFNQLLLDLKGPLELTCLEKAWQEVIKRHNILRSGFFSNHLSEPLQVVFNTCELPIDSHDWRGKSESEQDQLRNAYIEQDKQRGFEFSQAPLMRLALLRISDDHWQVLWSRHHLLLDGWSSARLVQEVMALYYHFENDVSGNQTPAAQHAKQLLAQTPKPFKDYIHWLRSQSLEKADAFWGDYLKGLEQPTPVPGVTQKLDETDSEQRYWTFELPSQLCSKLQSATKNYQVTLNSLVVAAWSILSARSFNNDVIFGVTSAGRSAPIADIETMLGVFINTLPVRVNVNEALSVKEFLRDIQSNQAQVREFEYTPLTQVQRLSDIGSDQPLFNNLLVFENYAVEEQDTSEQALELAVNESFEPTNYPLTLTVVPMGFDDKSTQGESKQPKLELQFAFTGVTQANVERIAESLETIIGSMISVDADTPISNVAVLNERQIQQQLVDWNNTATDYPHHLCWMDLFAEQVVKTPDVIAVACLDESLSYRELNDRSNQIAHFIKSMVPDTRDQVIALLDQRGINLLTMIVAVLKSGAAYLPLDPEHPPARLNKVVAKAGSPLVLIGDELPDFTQDADASMGTVANTQISKTKVVRYSESLSSDKNTTELTRQSTPSDLAYVIFTSGSTGEPKGAMVEHRGMLNNMYSKIPALSLSSDDAIAQTASQCFDISVWQFLTALMIGARVEIYPDSVSHDPNALFASIVKDSITILESVPSFIRMMLETSKIKEDDSKAIGDTLRWLLPTGEALPPQLAKDWLLTFPNIPLMNAYGPAECADDVAFWPIDQVPEEHCHHIPIGRPTDNNQLFILDAAQRPVPLGVEGELYVAGIGVGRGYLNDEERTTAAFIDNPFKDIIPTIPGADVNRLYRTGDLACYLEDGVIEYRGRVDYQVKIRGLRIELGEIEALLNNHDVVADAVVVADVDTNIDTNNQQRLVSYLVLSQPQESDNSQTIIENIRQTLQQQLPRYMIPAAFEVLEAMPLNANGKVDRKALPKPNWSQALTEYVAPENEIQEQLCEIWQSALNVERVGITDNFFELGGHSLMAIQLKSEIETQFEIEVTLVELFKHPTVKELAQLVSENEQQFSDDDLDWMDDLMSSMEDEQ
ncbi:amino acid adenylation domain-containing protein [Sessilibacter corallicola]|uniref:Carrier domain-containing protein n=1 Tax=Sessilibacter corallicola TaxID=2904075 RepID=A0ABQ0ACG3_9GAMM